MKRKRKQKAVSQACILDGCAPDPNPPPAPPAPPRPIEQGARECTIRDCSILNKSAETNEHTRAAIEALAHAVKANADAITACAHALRGGDVHLGTGIHVGYKA